MKFPFLEEYKSFLGNNYNTYFSPGRINLIGEHIDYLGGNVFPSAISLGTYAFVTKREDNELHFISHNFKQFGTTVVSLDNLEYKKSDNWTNYAKGMFNTYINKGHKITKGLNILIYGTLPNSSGLSSSASLEVLIGTMIKEEYNIPLTKLEIVLDSKDVENDFVGVNCGIMDQFAIGMAEKDHAIYLNTETLEYEQVPLLLEGHKILIANTNKKRTLADSKYNERVSECNEALIILNSNNYNIENLCELKEEQLSNIKPLLPTTIYNRVEHAVLENTRTINAVKELQSNNIQNLGKLLYQSHYSLKDLYEVSCDELDLLVEEFKNNNAVGARMTGAGFGGCAIAIVKDKHIKETIKNVKEKYLSKFGYNTDIYEVVPSEGPRKVKG